METHPSLTKLNMQRTHIDLEARVYTCHRISAIMSALKEDGVDENKVLYDSGISKEEVYKPETRVSANQIKTIYRNACRLEPDSTLALRAGSRMRMVHYGMFGFAVETGETFEARNNVVETFQHVAVPGVSIKSIHDEIIRRYQYEVLLTQDTADEVYRFTIEFCFSAFFALSCELYGPGFKFNNLQLMYATPMHASAYRILFDCPILFNQNANILSFNAELTEGATARAYSATHQMARDQCQQLLLAITKPAGIVFTIRKLLIENLPRRFPTTQAMAKELLMETRTLRRRLEDVGTTYGQILAEVRLELSAQYLLNTRMTTEQIASSLGYSDASNFRHAFIRWTGKTPRQYRLKQ